MAKLALKANPTFVVKVGIPVAGGPSVPVELTFKHRTKTELAEFLKTRADKPDVESFMDMVEGWELEDKFCRESVEQLLESYIGAALATYQAYVEELFKHKSGN